MPHSKSAPTNGEINSLHCIVLFCFHFASILSVLTNARQPKEGRCDAILPPKSQGRWWVVVFLGVCLLLALLLQHTFCCSFPEIQCICYALSSLDKPAQLFREW